LPGGKRPVILLDGCTVRIVGGDVDVPRRQGFAWADNAKEYAEKLSRERGWPIEVSRG